MPEKKKPANKRRKSPENPTRTIRTPANREKILDYIAKTGHSLSKAAVKLGLGIRTIYDWQAADPDFKAAVDAALEGPGTDALLDEAQHRALNGVEKVLTHQGEISYEIEKYEVEKSPNGKIYQKPVYKLDAAGQKIPVKVVEYDNGLLTRVIELRKRRKDLDLPGTFVVNIQAISEARQRVLEGKKDG